MNFLLILFIAVGLAMDAFAVAVAAGASVKERRTAQALRIGGSFGMFQMIMPVLGWLLGARLKNVIMDIDHWVVLALLSLIGIKMIYESFSSDDCKELESAMTGKRLLVLSLATSIDAFAVGMSFAFLECTVWFPAAIIGIVTFVIATAGVYVGHFLCCLWGKRAELAGGVILILIGLKIFMDHWLK